MNFNKKNKVWYVAYGTNLNKERFLCYINGGTPEGTYQSDAGCRDKSSPLDGGKISIPFQLYFAGDMPKWKGKGVGFLNPNPKSSVKTLGRKYLVTEEQFKDIFKQANGIDPERVIDIDFHGIRRKGILTVVESLYGRVIFLGEDEGSPVFTLTSHRDFALEHIHVPAEQYLKHIIKGIKQTYGISNEEIFEYLFEKPGIGTDFPKNVLLGLVQGS